MPARGGVWRGLTAQRVQRSARNGAALRLYGPTQTRRERCPTHAPQRARRAVREHSQEYELRRGKQLNNQHTPTHYDGPCVPRRGNAIPRPRCQSKYGRTKTCNGNGYIRVLLTARPRLRGAAVIMAAPPMSPVVVRAAVPADAARPADGGAAAEGGGGGKESTVRSPRPPPMDKSNSHPSPRGARHMQSKQSLGSAGTASTSLRSPVRRRGRARAGGAGAVWARMLSLLCVWLPRSRCCRVVLPRASCARARGCGCACACVASVRVRVAS